MFFSGKLCACRQQIRRASRSINTDHPADFSVKVLSAISVFAQCVHIISIHIAILVDIGLFSSGTRHLTESVRFLHF